VINQLLIFEVFPDELRYCEDGESLSLWSKSGAALIYVYRQGSANGQGKVATISKQQNPGLVEMLDTGWDVRLNYLKSGTTPKFELLADSPQIAAQHAAKNKDEIREEARALLTSSYNPVKRELTVKVRSREGRQFLIGETMSMPSKPLEKYLEELNFQVRLVGESGTVGWISAGLDLQKRILRASFNGYAVTGIVVAARQAPVYAGDQDKIWKEEECTASIFLKKPADVTSR